MDNVVSVLPDFNVTFTRLACDETHVKIDAKHLYAYTYSTYTCDKEKLLDFSGPVLVSIDMTF